jgi:hypothetical protein
MKQLLFIIGLALLGGPTIHAQNWDMNSIPPNLIDGSVTGEYVVKDIGGDNSSNLYVTGYYKGNFNNVASAGNSNDLFVAKYNSAHVLQWFIRIGSKGKDEGTAMAVLTGGFLYVAGSIEKAVTVTTTDAGGTKRDTTLNGHGRRGIFMKIQQATGNIVWVQEVKGITCAFEGEISDISVDRDAAYASRIVIVGTSNENTTFVKAFPSVVGNSLTIARPWENSNGFVACYSDAGRPMWATRITESGATDQSTVNGVCVVNRPGDNHAYITGSIKGDLGFGTISNYNTGGAVWAYMAKMNLLNGQFIWCDDIQHNQLAMGTAVTLDYTRVPLQPHVGGHFDGASNLTFSPGITANGVSPNGSDIFWAQYDVSGTCLWTSSAGGPGNDQLTHLLVDLNGTGNVFGMGNTAGDFSFAGKTVIRPDASSIFITKHDQWGTQQWIDYLQEPCAGRKQQAGGLAFNQYNLMVAGSTDSEIEFNANFPGMSVKRSPSTGNTASFYGRHYTDMCTANVGLTVTGRTPTSITVTFVAFPPPFGSRLYYRPKPNLSAGCIDDTPWILWGTFFGPTPVTPVTISGLIPGLYEVGVQVASGLPPNVLCEIGGTISYGTIVARQQQPPPVTLPPAPVEDQLHLQPNPASDRLLVTGHYQQPGMAYMTIADVQGRVVKQLPPVQQPGGRFAQWVPLSGLAAGQYLITVRSGKHLLTQKFVKRGD